MKRNAGSSWVILAGLLMLPGIVIPKALFALDWQTELTVAPASEDQVAAVLAFIKENLDADTNDKRAVYVNMLYKTMSVDRESAGPAELHVAADSPLVARMAAEQPALRKIFQSLQAKDGKINIWLILSWPEPHTKTPDGSIFIHKEKADNPFLVLQLIDGKERLQKTFQLSSRKVWYSAVIADSDLNPLVRSTLNAPSR
jgi:hypothetical protein